MSNLSYGVRLRPRCALTALTIMCAKGARESPWRLDDVTSTRCPQTLESVSTIVRMLSGGRCGSAQPGAFHAAPEPSEAADKDGFSLVARANRRKAVVEGQTGPACCINLPPRPGAAVHTLSRSDAPQTRLALLVADLARPYAPSLALTRSKRDLPY